MMRLLFSTRQAPLTTTPLFTLLSTTFRSAQTAGLPSVMRLFSRTHRLEQAPVQTAEEEAAHLERKRLERNALLRQRSANNPELRQKINALRRERYANDRQKRRDSDRRYSRNPIHRAKIKASSRARSERSRDKHQAASRRAHAEDLSYRRSTQLDNLVRRKAANALTWKTHTYVRYPDRVDHHCTGCNRDRFLMLWWKERPEVSEESGPDRYMCNHCFANDWPRVVPETYTGKLAKIFTSPELPLTKAQRAELGKEKEPESDKPRK